MARGRDGGTFALMMPLGVPPGSLHWPLTLPDEQFLTTHVFVRGGAPYKIGSSPSPRNLKLGLSVKYEVSHSPQEPPGSRRGLDNRRDYH